MGAMGLAFSGNLRPMTRILPISRIPVSEPRAGHALAQAAFLEEILFQPAELLIDQIISRLSGRRGAFGNRHVEE